MTYNVFSGMLNRAQAILPVLWNCWLGVRKGNCRYWILS